MRVNNRTFAYYNQTFDLILPITNRYIIIIRKLRSRSTVSYTTRTHDRVALDLKHNEYLRIL